jgi:UDP:flavonoid glycosyltransferase YjiC (YdhE family)
MRRPVVAVFCMPEVGHLQRLLPLIAGLARRGAAVPVFTAAAFRGAVERAGGSPVDLFADRPLDAADATSRPVPCRYVSFAAHYAPALLETVARLAPAVIVYDTFAVIGRVLARALGVPYVNVCAGHAMTPARALAALGDYPRVAPSDACWRAVASLRDRWGIADASPFAYFTGVSPFLNVYCEPPAFLPPEDRAALEPVAFFGSVAPPETGRVDAPAGPAFGPPGSGGGPRVYAAFGSVVWRYYEADAVQALHALADAVAARPPARAVVSLGGHRLEAAARSRLARPNVRVTDYVDQWRLLEAASVCVTHHGLNSTHEAIYHRVPMLSYPFFADQPPLAACCQALGLAVPLAGAPRAALDPGDVGAALARVEAESAAMAARLARAREWEVEAIDGRDAVVRRILALGGAGRP